MYFKYLNFPFTKQSQEPHFAKKKFFPFKLDTDWWLSKRYKMHLTFRLITKLFKWRPFPYQVNFVNFTFHAWEIVAKCFKFGAVHYNIPFKPAKQKMKILYFLSTFYVFQSNSIWCMNFIPVGSVDGSVWAAVLRLFRFLVALNIKTPYGHHMITVPVNVVLF